MYDQKFDAKAYWATKPTCTVCGMHKVKNGSVCHKCKGKVLKQKQAQAISITTDVSTSSSIKANKNNISPQTKEKVSDVKYDKNFVKTLLDKLKIGNLRSIHLNAIPGRSATRLDLHRLSEVQSNLPMDFVNTLLTNEKFSFPISFDKIDLGELEDVDRKKLALISKRLNNIVIEKEDNFLEFGLKNFGFGYPLLIKRDQNDPTKIIKAPLFIWHLDIERSYQNKNNWIIKKDEESPIRINELLVSHLSKDESVKIEKISNEILEDGILDKKELIGLVKKTLLQLNSKPSKLSLKVDKCPDSKEIEAIANSKPWIQWSGVLGIYRSQKETIIHSTEELLERFDEFENEKLVLEQFQTSSISAVETDPSKEEIVNSLMSSEIKLIQGPPGTGKSQSITAIVSNALANNATCLIVCEKKTALDVINKNLKEIGLDGFSIVIDDVNKDRKKVIQKARSINDSQSYPAFSNLNFEEKYKKFCELKDEINSKHSESLQKVFGDFSWKQLIGLYLRYSKSGDVEHVTTKISCSHLKFDHVEYSKYLSFVEEAAFLYGDMEKDSENIFSTISDGLFALPYKSIIKENIKNHIHKSLKIIKLASDFISSTKKSDYEEKGISIFQSKSINKYGTFASSTKERLNEIISLYKEGIGLVGDKFNKKGFLHSARYQFSAVFSKRNRRVLSIRKRIPTLVQSANASIAGIRKLGFKDLNLENFDTDVHEKLKINLRESKAYLEIYEKWLWDISQYFLGDKADYAKDEYSFTLKQNPFPGENIKAGPYKIGKNIEDAHIYRPGHPLAERILREVKSQVLPSAEVIFDYSNHGQIISPIKELVGTSGILQLSELTIDSFETEDSILVTAIKDNGELIEEDIAKKLFLLSADVNQVEAELSNKEVQQKEQIKASTLTSSIAERNGEFFDDEVDKLDKWAEDVKKSLEIELKRMDIDIKTMKTTAKKVLNLQEKIQIQRKIKDLEKKRNDLRQKLYQAQDQVDVKKENLLERVEAQLKQKTTITRLFTIRFKVI